MRIQRWYLQIDKMDTTELRTTIQNGKTAELKKAVKFAVKNNLQEVGEDIYQVFLKIKGKQNKWALQVELIKALDALEFKDVADDLKQLIHEDKPHDMVTIAAATAYVRLTREDQNDISGVIALLDKGISVITGALKTLAMEPSTPDVASVNIILSKTESINKHPQRIGREFGLIDPRLYVAIAANYWESENKERYLKHCIQTAFNVDRFGKEVLNTQLKQVCENSLIGKPSKGYI